MSSEPGGIRTIDGEALRVALPVGAAVDALEVAFREGHPNAAPLRTVVPTRAGDLLLMPAADAAAVGVKLVTVTPANPERGLPFVQAAYLLFDGETQAPVALLDGAALTALRTSAVSALATRHLARLDAADLVVFGAGVQARAHIEAMVAVRPIRRVTIVSRARDRAEALAAEVAVLGLASAVGEADAVAEADVVCTCTTSDVPVFDGALLREGAHVNAIGAYRPDARELDSAAMQQAAIVVETREAALAESGELLLAFGDSAADRIDADLAEVVRGAEVSGRHSVFVSVGLAVEDLAVATAVVSEGAAG